MSKLVNENEFNENGVARIPQTQEQVDEAKQRLILEYEEIHKFWSDTIGRAEKLRVFLGSEVFKTLPTLRQRQLSEQIVVMDECVYHLHCYLARVGERLYRWEEDK